jgi:hypothetical protein
MKNALFWDVRTHFVHHRRHITSPLQSSPVNAVFGILCSVALVRTDVSEKYVAFVIKVTRIVELGKTLAVTSNFYFFRPDDGGGTFLRNVASYKSHQSHPRKRYYL